MNSNSNKVYKAALYYRLSDEDREVSRREKKQSDSIANQKNLIKDFLMTKNDIKVCGEYTDDGVSGASFSRPAFNEMMKQIEAGKIDCVVVKDLSRFGREYVDAGNLLERVFPTLGVRFISINDNIDTLNGMDTLLVALKNIMNDAYSRDISIKIRSNLEVKRKHGEFIGNFAIYGYDKDPQNKNRLVIDDYAAHIVQDIFLWRIQGMSCNAIAEKLNKLDILSPYEYKLKQGLLFYTSFKEKQHSKWEAVTVRRILENENYVGTLVQGKRTTPNHKVKKVFIKEEDKWAKVENTHDAIISKRDYEIVQKLTKLDTRTAPGEQSCYPLSGMLICGSCGSNMVRRIRKIDGKIYVYYDCLEHNQQKRCFSHNVREDKMEAVVLETIKYQIELLIKMKECIQHLDLNMLTKLDVDRLNKVIAMQEADILRYRNLSKSLYEDLRSGLLSKDDYISYKSDFEEKKRQAERALTDAKIEMGKVKSQNSEHYKWVDNFIKYQDIGQLTRTMVLELVEKIVVQDKKHIEVTLAFQDEYEEAYKQFICTGHLQEGAL